MDPRQPPLEDCCQARAYLAQLPSCFIVSRRVSVSGWVMDFARYTSSISSPRTGTASRSHVVPDLAHPALILHLRLEFSHRRRQAIDRPSVAVLWADIVSLRNSTTRSLGRARTRKRCGGYRWLATPMYFDFLDLAASVRPTARWAPS